MTSPITDLINDLKDKLGAVQGTTNVLMVYSDADLRQCITGVQGLSIGVMYEGTRVKDNAQSAGRGGLSGEVYVSLLIVHPQTILGQQVPKDFSLQKLDEMRNIIRLTKSTTGHLWRFVAEAPAMEKEGTVVWLQRWCTPIQLTQGMT